MTTVLHAPSRHSGRPTGSGVLLLDKDSGMTSNAALQRAKRLIGARKAGHTGSLDPLASGLLPICFGEATKLAGFLLDTDKRYRVTIRMGMTTDSGDADGQILEQRPVPRLTASAIDDALRKFRGPILQVPPMYSALKHQGRRLYEFARRGIEIERPARPVEIFDLTLLGFNDSHLDLDVHCSKGTYIRVLAEDIGRDLGCGAHVATLRRTAVGSLDIGQALRLGQLEQMDAEARHARLQPPDVLVPALPVLDVGEADCKALQHGQAVRLASPLMSGLVRLRTNRLGFIGIGEACREPGWIAPRRMFQLAPVAEPPTDAASDDLGSMRHDTPSALSPKAV